jgi:hypothetical protein
MRRTYISPEYYNNNVYGTFNMVEESNFFGSKMLEVEDSISIESQDIIFYQRLNNEQIDFSIESSLQSYVYSPSVDKLSNHTLVIDESQTKYQLDKDTRWVMNINLKQILSNYLFATLKRYRTFEGVRNEMNKYNDVDVAIKSYIDFNVLDRYKYSSIELYIDYKDMRSQSLLRYKNDWNINTPKSSRLTKIQSETAFDNSNIKLSFNQEKPSSDYNFDYYFNILFEKI